MTQGFVDGTHPASRNATTIGKSRKFIDRFPVESDGSAGGLRDLLQRLVELLLTLGGSGLRSGFFLRDVVGDLVLGFGLGFLALLLRLRDAGVELRLKPLAVQSQTPTPSRIANATIPIQR